MTSYELVGVVLGAVFFGALCTLLVQWGAAIRALSNDVRETSRRVTALVSTVEPIARRAERLSRPLEESEGDVRRMAQAFHEISVSAARVSDGVSRAATWGTLLAPVLASAVERLRARPDDGFDPPAHDEPADGHAQQAPATHPRERRPGDPAH